MNEAELRLTEIRKAKKKFERRFLKSMEDRLEVNQPEKVLQYLEDRLKVKKNGYTEITSIYVKEYV